ncbi:MAG: hypothetical protein AABW56_03540 [Nanoarchaeota archaeon]
MKQKISLTVEEEIYQKFLEYCKERGMKVSSKVEIMMKEELKKKDE